MRFGHRELFTRDPHRARGFYEEVLGFTVTSVQPGNMVWLERGDVEILLRPGSPPASPPCYDGCGAGIVLSVEDAPRILEELRKRGLVVRGTAGTEKGHTFTDPDGNWFRLVDPSDPA